MTQPARTEPVGDAHDEGSFDAGSFQRCRHQAFRFVDDFDAKLGVVKQDFTAQGWAQYASYLVESKLSDSQLSQLCRLIVGNDPRQLSFGLALWTRGMVQELIVRQFGVRLSLVSVGRALAGLGMRL